MATSSGIERFCGSEFFNADTTFGVNSTYPEFSDCFRRTVLVWAPVIFLWLATPFQIYLFFVTKSLPLPWTWLLVCKLLLLDLLVLTSGVEFIYAAIVYGSGAPGVHASDYVAPLLICLSMLNLLCLSIGCRQRGLITSGVIFLSWLLFVVCGVPEFAYQVTTAMHLDVSQVDSYESVRTICYLIYYPLLILSLILSGFADKPAQYLAVGKGGEKPCPENYASFLNKITFSWFSSMAMAGWRRSLNNEDLWALNDEDTSKTLVAQWESVWQKKMKKYWHQKELASRRQNAQFKVEKPEEVKIADGTSGRTVKPPQAPSVVHALYLCYKWLFIPATITKTIADALQFVSPQLLSALIAFVANKNEPLWKGFMYAGLMFACSIFYSVLLHQYFHWMMRMGMNVRTVLVSALFRKSLRLSNAARRQSTTGEIVNLMSVDTQRFMDITTYVNMLWSAPFQIVLSLYFLWQELGPSVLAGVGIMILMIPLNFFLSAAQRRLQFAQMKFKDDRIKLINEILNGIKVLKLYAWEESFEKEVLGIRRTELDVLKKSSYYGAFTMFSWTCAPFLVSVVTFATYVLSDPVNNVLTPQRAFVSLSLFNILRFPMTILPMMVSFMVQASVSNKRMKDFLVAEELDPEVVAKNADQKEALNIVDGTFSWDKENTGAKPVLEDINLAIPVGQLVAVVGQVGHGKSSLLAAMLGEMEKWKGKVSTKGKVAYVPQLAWIQNLSLRDNVTFSKSYDPVFYKKVVESCSLQPDFEMLPGGDCTEIGEKGINLSGGQKQRVSLARAVYQDSDIYFLDDPLSAVDAHVGRHIFDNVISHDGLLKGKTRILVTHGLGYLKRVDKIVVLRDGRISEMGTYEELLAQKGAFAELIATYLKEKAQELDESEEAEEDASVLEEVLGDLEKVDPTAREKLMSQLSHDGSGAPKSPSPERQLSRLLSRQQSSIGGDAKSNEAAGSPPSPERQITRSSRASTIDDGKGQFSRQKSESAKSPPPQTKNKLIVEETSETGHVKWQVYKDYLTALGWWACIIIVILNVISNGFAVGTNVWLADWSNDADVNASLNETEMNVDIRLSVYAAFGIGQAVFVLLGAVVTSYAMIVASAYLHSTLLHNLLRSPMSFYDITPMGRIVNRIGKDVDIVDNTLSQNLRSWIGCVINVFSTIIVIIISTPIFAAVVVPLGLVYYFVQRFYISTSRQLKRLESVSRSPIYSHFQETIAGAGSIRAYDTQLRFIEESERRVDVNQTSYYPNVVSNRWLAIRLEFVGNLMVLFAAVFAVIARDYGDRTTAGLVGLSVSYALSITQTLNWAVRMTSDVESNIVAVERIKEYSVTPTEAEWHTDVKVPSNWPQQGFVKFDHYALRYRPDLDLVLKQIYCDINGGERIGIVGRTGAGKSSLTLALFRMIEGAGGKIVIDGVDISKIGLHDLRSRLTIIPQDPVLFSGTLRMNLDPFEKHSDSDIWRALEHSHLKDFVAQTPGKLMSRVNEGGENLSVGQRQLICLARALLRKTKVLVLDEATSAVDLETEDLILKTIGTHFSDCTILTIAHRLNTIMDSHRVLVLSNGRIAEFDSPERLLSDERTVFYSMAKDAGVL